MTISVTTPVQQYTGTGLESVLNTVFPFFVNADVVVTRRVTATGLDTLMVLGVHYTMLGGSSTGATGTVTPIDGSVDFTSSVTWTIERVIPLTQDLDYVENDTFPAESHEAGLDRITMQIQDREQIFKRSLRYPVDDVTSLTSELPDSVTRASKALTFDSAGNVTVTTPADASGTSVTATGSTTARTLQERFGEVANVKDFGAKGDDSTNDYAAIQAAIDSIDSLNGGEVFFPVGIYLCDSTLKLPSDITMSGIQGASVIKSGSGLSGSVSLLQMKVLSGVLGTYENKNVHITKLIFDGASKALSIGNELALLRLWKISNLTLSDCELRNHNFMLLAIGGVEDFNIERNEFSNYGAPVAVPNGGSAMWVSANPTDETLTVFGSIRNNYIHDGEWSAIEVFSDSVSIVENRILDVSEAGIFCNTVGSGADYVRSKISLNTIRGVRIKNIQGAGMEIGGVNHIISFNDVEDTDGAGILLTDPSKDVTCSFNHIRDTVRDLDAFPSFGQLMARSNLVTANDPSGLTIEGNKIRDNANPKKAPFGILLSALGGAKFTNTVVRGNDVKNSSLNAGDEIGYESAPLGDKTIVFDNAGDSTENSVNGTKALPASTGNVVIDGVGFRPRQIEFRAIVTSASVVQRSESKLSIGVGPFLDFIYSDGTVSRAGSLFGTSVIRLVDSSGTTVFDATLGTFDDDGFTIAVGTASIACVLIYTCIP